jgi:hypothetical protein
MGRMTTKVWNAVPAPPAPIFGPALFAARVLRGYSRGYVAAQARIPPGRLKLIEEGKDEPDGYEWQKIWRVLSTSTDPPPPPPSGTP